MPGPARNGSEAAREARRKWWTEARFGLFVHWGLSALPARHEVPVIGLFPRAA